MLRCCRLQSLGGIMAWHDSGGGLYSFIASHWGIHCTSACILRTHHQFFCMQTDKVLVIVNALAVYERTSLWLWFSIGIPRLFKCLFNKSTPHLFVYHERTLFFTDSKQLWFLFCIPLAHMHLGRTRFIHNKKPIQIFVVNKMWTEQRDEMHLHQVNGV